MLDGHTISSLYLQSPTPEYRHAFNLAFNGSEFRQEPILAVTSSVVHAVELLKRCRAPLHFLGTDDFDAAQFIADAQSFAWGPLRAVPIESLQAAYNSLVWAEPEVHSGDSLIQFFNRLAAPEAVINIIASGPLRRFLPAWQAAPYPARQPLSPGKVMRLLSTAGWKIDRQVAFHGPRSIFWSWLVRAAERAGRPDWADRCLFAMRGSYQEPGWLWVGSPLSFIRARYFGYSRS